MRRNIINLVESGKFEDNLEAFFKALERPMRAALWFIAGYFAFAVVRMFQ